MKRLILTAISVSLITTGLVGTSYARFGMKGEPPRKEMKMHEHFAEKLNLTAEQKAQADKIREDGRKKMEPLMQEGKVLYEKMEKIRKENMDEFEKILTKEQKAEFVKMKEQRRRPHGREFGVPPHLRHGETPHADSVSERKEK